MDDVLFSGDRFSKVSAARSSLVNALNPDAPIVSMTATDPETLLVKVAKPIIYIPSLLQGVGAGSLVIMPKEAGGGYDPRQDVIGTGPFTFAGYQPQLKSP